MRSVFTGRLLGKFLLWLVPSFLLVSAAGIFLVVEHDMRRETEAIVARVGNHAGRVAAALARHDIVANADIGYDLTSSLLADRAVRCAQVQSQGAAQALINVPRGLVCHEQTADHTLDIPVDEATQTQLVIRLDFSEMNEARLERRNLAFLALVFGLGVAALASLLAFRQTIQPPLVRLLGAIRYAATTGELVPVINNTNDELGVVIDNYNAMQDRLSSESASVRASLAHIDHLYHETPAPMFCVAPDGTITQVSDFWLAFSGYERADVINQPLSEFLRPVAGNVSGACLVRDTAATTDPKQCEVLVIHKTGRAINSLLSVSQRDASIGGYLCVVTDISHLRQAERALRLAAVTDRLTGLPNRAALQDVALEMAGQMHADERMAVLYIDLDNFKQVNDTFGHEAGDRLLIEAVRRMKRSAGERACLFRLGGDEFALLTPDGLGDQQSLHIAQSIVDEVARPIDVGGGVGFVSASIGIAYLAPGDTNCSEGLRCADVAMYQTKQDGKSGYTIYTHELGEQVGARTARAILIRQGLEANWFSLNFQPIVRLSDLRPVGAEALLRLQRPGCAPEPTLAIIQTAEETGQIERISNWVMSDALSDAAGVDALSTPGSYLAVNISTQQINHTLLPALRHRLERTGFSPKHLVIEVTETALIRNFDEAVKVLAEVRALGVRVALDDFGTGYSSLSYLAKLPVDILKLDSSLTAGMGTGTLSEAEHRKAVALVRSVTSLAADFGISIVAEGIETLDAARELAELGVQYGQGYAFSPPLPKKAFRDWIALFDRAQITPVEHETRHVA